MKRIYEYLQVTALLSPIYLMIALGILMDFTDPPFIENAHYDFLVYKTIPFITLILIVYFHVLIIKKYKRCETYRKSLKKNISSVKGLLTLLSGYIVIPLVTFGLIHFYVTYPIKLLAYFTENDYWYKEFILKEVSKCGSDYESGCTNLEFLDPKTQKIHSFRWYEDKSTIMNSKEHYVYIVGEASYFGYIVRGLDR